MYKVCVDGALLWRSDDDSAGTDILTPKLKLDVNGAGSLSFVMPPGNLLYNSVKKLKSIITVEEDGDIIFRGRVMDDTRDFYNQKSVYCEGDRSFLLDSLKKPYSYNGNVQAFFRELVSGHNGQVDAEKRFTVGNITAVDASLTMEAEDDSYQSTSDAIENRLLGAYGGYMATRTAGGVTYLDWLKELGGADAREISFSVNLLELKDKLDAADIFTVLLPLGSSNIDSNGDQKDPVSIASVNGGVEYIQDDDAVSLYGKIWRAQTWSNEDDPSALLTKAREFLKTGALLRTITLTAVDMHFIDSAVASIHIGDKVHILSNPHGMDLTMACTQMEIDLLNPESTTYTFGEPPKTLTENYIKTDKDVAKVSGRKGGKSANQKVGDVYRWAKVTLDEQKAQIMLAAEDRSKITNRVSHAEILIDGMQADIKLKAERSLVNELESRVTSAEVDIDGMNANIKLKADATVTDDLGTRLSSAEITLDGLNSEIELKADKITLDGYVTMSKFNAEIADIKITDSSYVTTAALNTKSLGANYAEISSINIGGKQAHWESVTIVTGVSRKKRYAMAPSGSTSMEFYECSGVSTDTFTILMA